MAIERTIEMAVDSFTTGKTKNVKLVFDDARIANLAGEGGKWIIHVVDETIGEYSLSWFPYQFGGALSTVAQPFRENLGIGPSAIRMNASHFWDFRKTAFIEKQKNVRDISDGHKIKDLSTDGIKLLDFSIEQNFSIDYLRSLIDFLDSADKIAKKQ